MAERPDHRPLVERVRPQTPGELVGQRAGQAELERWADAWSDPRNPPRLRAAVLEGPPGVGKTTAALALARARGWTVVELNASDARNERAIQEIAGRASLSMTLGDSGTFRRPEGGGRALILLDEADCLSGRKVEEGAGTKAAPLSFREFVRGRYGSLEEVTKAWRLGQAGRGKPFEDWTEIPLSGGRAAWTRSAEVQRDLADWRGAAKPKDRSDRGGLGAIADLVQHTRQPVVLTVNDIGPLTRFSQVFSRGVARIRFEPLAPAELQALLTRTAQREGWPLQGESLDAFVRRARGDARAALNDLEAWAPLAGTPHALVPFAVRDRSEELRELTEDILSEGRFYSNGEIHQRLDDQPDELLPWIEENIPWFASSTEGLAAALEPLARADLQLTRARRQRIWRLWSYASELMTGGVAIAIAEHGGAGATRARFPQFLGEMGRSRIQRAMRDAITEKAGARWHLSRRKARAEFLPFLERWLSPRGHALAMAGAPARRERIAEELGLSRAELAYVAGVDEAGLPSEPTEERAVEVEPPAVSPGPSAPPAPQGETKRRQRRLGDFAG